MSAVDPVTYFNDWFFTTNQTDQSCPGFGSFGCPAPGKACARDPGTGRRYCCDGPAGGRDSVCWTLKTSCRSDGTTIDCGDGGTSWCCLSGTEKCTETKNQINICWSKIWDPLNNVSAPDLARTYSSLSKARPSASSLSLDLAAVIRATANGDITSASSKASAAAKTSQANPAGLSGATTTAAPGPRLSGGAIAGIVIGSIAGLCLILTAVWFVLRHRRLKRRRHESAVTPTIPDAADEQRRTMGANEPALYHMASQADAKPAVAAEITGYGDAAALPTAAELHSRPTYELSPEQTATRTTAHELLPNQFPVELHGESAVIPQELSVAGDRINEATRSDSGAAVHSTDPVNSPSANSGHRDR